jgi:phosphoribosylanthranilate isomerase
MKKFNASIPLVKICCISSIDEADIAIKCGANALGLVAEMPSGPGVISEKEIANIAAFIPPGITSVLLTSKTSPQKIIEQHKRCRTNAIQLCDKLDSNHHRKLRQSLPGISLIQVIHVRGEESIEEALHHENVVDALLLDTGSRSDTLTELGGTGRTHDWSVSAQIRNKVNLPVFLAGGLNPENVGIAINKIKPFAVDVCSGVRTDGKLDKNKLAAFITIAKSSYKA